MRAARGFTLVEMLVVLVISAALLALVPPLLSRQLEGANLERSSRALVAALRSARVAAMAEQRDVSIRVDLKQKQFVDHRGKAHTLPEDAEITLRTASSEVSDRQTGAIRFFADGSATGGGLSLISGRGQRHVQVDWLTGRTRVSDAAPQPAE